MIKLNAVMVLGFLVAAAPAHAATLYSCQGTSGLREFTVEVSDGNLGEVTFYFEGNMPLAHTDHLERNACAFGWCWNTLIASSPAAESGAPAEPAHLAVQSTFLAAIQSQQLPETTVMLYKPVGRDDSYPLTCTLENQ